MASQAVYASDPAKGWRPWGVLVPFLGIFFVVLTGGPLEYLFADLHLLEGPHDDPAGLLGFVAFLVGPFGLLALATFAWVRFVERRPFSTIGLTSPGGAATFAGGLLTGALMMCATVGGIWLSGGLTVGAIAPAFASAASIGGIALLLAAFAIQSSAEEILFRGWMLSALATKFGTIAAVIVSSAVFTLLHFDRHAPLLVLFNTYLFALFACSWSLRTGNIWGVMGWHSAWNWLLGTGFELRITGLDTHMPALLVKLTQTGPGWLTGGADGSEGGVICTVVLCAGIAWNFWWKRAAARLSTP
ncbi:MAG: CPBP family intramembrane metalloprotease [Alphaproteobacteria bacterium]|nr:CPBP family intramembrane metalloprotease [Alphaproteobacteria bacterium]MBL6939363.1 CPBP family intramembrane metalloprotease [Alphaproteobacteria bacterium]MBL7097156.1 CPBP family intramembrane metalloprotease [Alphaproteobacteria bacterium]